MSAIEIPGYKIVRTLGVGGQATVYLAIQTGFDREVALKVMSPVLAADPTFGERFIREAKIVAKLSHKNIVTVYDAGQSGNFYYLAMEYMPGGELKTRIEKGMKARECLTIISKLALALHFAHEKGYIHRDVKSENILFDADDEPVLNDFGIAKASNSSTQMTQTGKLIGTPEYMSPEQCRGKKIDGRTDLYSLGVILYEMLTKAVPYTGEDSVSVCIKHVTQPIPKLPVRLKHFQWLIELLMTKDPAGRFQTGMELAKAVNQFKKTGQQSSEIGSAPVVTKKQKTEAANKAKAKTVISNSLADTEFVDDLHTEKRMSHHLEEPAKSSVNGVLMVMLIILIIGGGYVTRDTWFDKAYRWVQVNLLKQADELANTASNPAGSPQSSSQQLLSRSATTAKTAKKQIPDRQSAGQDAAQSDNLNNDGVAADSTKGENSDIEAQPTVAAGSTSELNAGELLLQADSLAQYTPHALDDIKQALKLIATVNTLEPNSSGAKLVFENLMSTSLAEAATLARNGDFEKADEWVKLVEYEQAEHPLLEATKQNLQTMKQDYDSKQQERLAKQNQVAELLIKASEAIDQDRVDSPLKRNAMHFYQQALILDPDNAEAIAGIRQISQSYLEKLEQAIADQSFTKAKSLLAKYETLSADAIKVNYYQKKIGDEEKAYIAAQKVQREKARLEEKKRAQEAARLAHLNEPMVQMRLQSSLISAKSLENSGLLVQPEGNNALAKYRAALTIDENNADAKQGINRIESTILQQLTSAVDAPNLTLANQWLEKLRLFNANHNKLSSFESVIIDIQQRARQIAVENQPLPSAELIEASEQALESDNVIDELTNDGLGPTELNTDKTTQPNSDPMSTLESEPQLQSGPIEISEPESSEPETSEPESSDTTNKEAQEPNVTTESVNDEIQSEDVDQPNSPSGDTTNNTIEF